QVQNAQELEASLGQLLETRGRREELGVNARAVVRANQGAVAKTVEMIVEQLRSAKVQTHISSK
ncbi:MAG: hypothetical protein JWM68_327, partial [Verrucomicrobiales bacterium]|nr:hypothetical protein [Verrucomicrobiales bacterium]